MVAHNMADYVQPPVQKAADGNKECSKDPEEWSGDCQTLAAGLEPLLVVKQTPRVSFLPPSLFSRCSEGLASFKLDIPGDQC